MNALPRPRSAPLSNAAGGWVAWLACEDKCFPKCQFTTHTALAPKLCCVVFSEDCIAKFHGCVKQRQRSSSAYFCQRQRGFDRSALLAGCDCVCVVRCSVEVCCPLAAQTLEWGGILDGSDALLGKRVWCAYLVSSAFYMMPDLMEKKSYIRERLQKTSGRASVRLFARGVGVQQKKNPANAGSSTHLPRHEQAPPLAHERRHGVAARPGSRPSGHPGGKELVLRLEHLEEAVLPLLDRRTGLADDERTTRRR